ncbi:MAG: threonylcarbamoyl-AMP synthase [Oscillospiraceae bacterium]|nr:threonylcarbamoyl-AMP synthase [Oscillospiraceae bacterium]
METLLLNAKNEGAIDAAAKILKNGGLVAIPTETVYGLAANAFDAKACADIFKAKGRPGDNPLIVHICDMDMLGDIVEEVPEGAKKLAEEFWPGPLTMIMKKSEKIPDVTSAGLPSVAVRFPSHPVAREIIEKAGLPLAAPSANLSGSPSPTTFEHCVHDLMGRVDGIIDGGASSVGVESTIISFAGEKPVLLRPGYVTLEQLRETLGEVEISHAVLEKLEEGEKVLSPGMKYKHYAPKAQVTLIKADSETYVNYVNEHEEEGVFALCFDEEAEKLSVSTVTYGSEFSDEEQAEHIFEALRMIDESGAKRVYAHSPKVTGVGLAVYNRLIRAAGFDVIEL